MRTIVLGGAARGRTKYLNGFQFINGETHLEVGPEDFAKILLYFEKCYQATEKRYGERALHPDPGSQANPLPPSDGQLSPVESRASASERSPEGSANERILDAPADAGAPGSGSEGNRQTRPEAETRKILEAIGRLEVPNDEHWSADTGLPRVDAVAGLSGIQNLTRGDLDELAPGLRRNNGDDQKNEASPSVGISAG